MMCRASRCVVASTELNSDDVDTRDIDNNEIFLNRTRAGIWKASVTELKH